MMGNGGWQIALLLGFKQRRNNVVAIKYFIEIRSISSGNSSGMGDVAGGHLQKSDQVTEFEFTPGLVKCLDGYQFLPK